MKIPVFHDDQHGTAIIVGAAVLNGLELAGQEDRGREDLHLGGGAAALACLNLLVAIGAKHENVTGSADKGGLVHPQAQRRQSLQVARPPPVTRMRRTLAEVREGADVFLGLSAPAR
jgi:malate dehydrogenase (oxaloacetate-decarboxylating)(NADP+)